MNYPATRRVYVYLTVVVGSGDVYARTLYIVHHNYILYVRVRKTQQIFFRVCRERIFVCLHDEITREVSVVIHISTKLINYYRGTNVLFAHLSSKEFVR